MIVLIFASVLFISSWFLLPHFANFPCLYVAGFLGDFISSFGMAFGAIDLFLFGSHVCGIYYDECRNAFVVLLCFFCLTFLVLFGCFFGLQNTALHVFELLVLFFFGIITHICRICHLAWPVEFPLHVGFCVFFPSYVILCPHSPACRLFVFFAMGHTDKICPWTPIFVSFPRVFLSPPCKCVPLRPFTPICTHLQPFISLLLFFC